MAERRALGAAMNLTEEKLAFIKGDSPPNAPTISNATSVASQNDGVVQADVITEPVHNSPLKVDSGSGPSIARSTKLALPKFKTAAQPDFYGQILVPLTTRLTAPTADALRRACLEQKLARKSPDTQQEIVEMAVVRWLEGSGFL